MSREAYDPLANIDESLTRIVELLGRLVAAHEQRPLPQRTLEDQATYWARVSRMRATFHADAFIDDAPHVGPRSTG